MNQPASKEPTMDEILSSIRQIIADDDEAAARKAPPQPVLRAAAPSQAPAPERAFSPRPAADVIDPFADDEDDEADIPLALSTEQIVGDRAHAPERAGTASGAREEVIAFDPAPQPVLPRSPASHAESLYGGAAGPADLDDVTFADPEPVDPAPTVAPHPVHSGEARPAIAQVAPLPDPDLTSDLADQLLEPATGAAVRDAFARLGTQRVAADLAVGSGGLTIESMLRDMLRPMLKDWLDENLPAMVERLVEQEIERVSRGGR